MISFSTAPSQRVVKELTYYKEAEQSIERNFPKSFNLFGKAIEASKKDNDHDLFIKSLNKVASLNQKLNQEQSQQVLQWLKESIPVLKIYPENSDCADWHFYIGYFYVKFSYEIDTALFHLERSKTIRIKYSGPKTEGVAKCFLVEGDIYKYYKLDFLKAEQCYENALQIFELIKFDDVWDLARIYYSLATTNRSQQDFEKAISYGIKAIELVKKTGNLNFLEQTYTVIGNIYRDMGESAIAKVHFQNAIELNLKIKSKDVRSSERLAWHYTSVAETLMNDSLFGEAIVNFIKARSIYNRIDESEPLLYVNCLYQMAQAFLFHRSYHQCFQVYNDLLETLVKLQIHKGRHVAEAYRGLGEYYQAIKQYDSAMVYYQKALSSATKPFSGSNPHEDEIGVNYYIYEILNRKASLLNDLYDETKQHSYLQESLECLTLSEKLMTSERNSLDLEDSKWKFLDANYNVYDQIVNTLYRMKNMNSSDTLFNTLFGFLERSKSRSLADALDEAERFGEIGIDDSIFLIQSQLKRELFKVQDKLGKALQGLSTDAGTVNQWRIELVNIDRRIQNNKLIIETKYPGYFRAKYVTTAHDIAHVQNLLSKKDQVLLDYFFGNGSVYALCITEDKFSFQRLGTADSIQRIIQGFLKHFDHQRYGLSKEVYKAFADQAHSLYQVLVHPFDSLLADYSRIVIIPDGIVSQIPFEALISEPAAGNEINYKSLQYLIKRHHIGYAYSFSVMMNKPSKSIPAPSLLAIAFAGEESAQSSSLQILSGASDELQTLSVEFTAGKFLNNNDATEANFKKFASSFDIIHLAVHGRGETGKQNNSSLYFKSSMDSLEDNELHFYELYGLKLKAQLVVLSACESGLGVSYKGEGMLSMASAFANAGSENILVSLWRVNDQASLQLMKTFYQGLKNGHSIDEALAKAKYIYMESADELSADPRIWAPLVAYGSLEPVIGKDRTVFYLIIFLCVLFFALMLLLFIRRFHISIVSR